MKTKLSYLLFLGFLALFSCKKEDPELGNPPTAAEAAFTYRASAGTPNIIEFTATTSDAIASWDFGNETSAQGTSVSGIYPNKGIYTVTLTIYARGGSASSSQEVVIANDDLTLLSSPLFTILTGGSDNGGQKTWVVDSNNASHFGVGPNPAGAAGFWPEFYAATPNEKEGASMYDDRYTFHLNAFKFDMVTNGLAYINEQEKDNFAGSYESPVGDYIAPFDNKLDETWQLSTSPDTTLTLSGGAFMGYYAGTSTYKVVAISENELFLRCVDANDGALSWYIRLIPEDFVTTTPIDTTDTTTSSVGVPLPIDFETVEPTFEAFGGSSVAIVDNPDASGINTSNRVLETVHGNEPWAGIFVDLDAKLDFATETSIAVKVWAPTTGTFRIKIENQNNDQEFVQKDVMVTTANAWQEVSIDFSEADAGLYDRLVLFPGWDVPNAGTFYVDDLEQK